MYCSTCFGRPHAHHQELNNCSSSLWFYLRSVVIAMLLVVVGPDHDQQHCYHHALKVKPEAATAVVELQMMGVRTPETCWVVHKRQVINLKTCCIWLVDLFEKYDIIWIGISESGIISTSADVVPLFVQFCLDSHGLTHSVNLIPVWFVFLVSLSRYDI